jgi:NAD(P)-dependent dehydrogenase (short-subunit alcohol dehydrogenase family)
MKRALVTGGSGGIGAAICRKLAAQGCDVLVHANGNIDRAEAVAPGAPRARSPSTSRTRRRLGRRLKRNWQPAPSRCW